MDDCPICGGKSLVTTTRTNQFGGMAYKCNECLILWPTKGPKKFVASCSSAMSMAHS